MMQHHEINRRPRRVANDNDRPTQISDHSCADVVDAGADVGTGSCADACNGAANVGERTTKLTVVRILASVLVVQW